MVNLPKRHLLLALLAGLIGSLAVTGAAQAAPGDLTTSFAGDGRATLSVFAGLPTRFTDVASEADGKLVSVGWTDAPSTPSNLKNTLIARFDRDGSLDPTFASGG